MPLLTVQEAAEAIRSRVPAVRIESIPLTQAASRVLAESVAADRDYPPINRATMDGIAIHSDSWNHGVRAWNIEGTIPAGEPAQPLRDPHHGCAQIMTGAEIPEHCDAVIPFEEIEQNEDKARAVDVPALVAGQNIHVKSSDRRKGDLLLSPGALLNAPRLAILAAVGQARVQVAVRPRVMLLSTGDEIVPVDHAGIQPTQVRASNLVGLESALLEMGIRDIEARHIPDDPAATRLAIEEALTRCDVLVMSGGVSKGHFDFVPGALREAGVEMIFHGVAQKPGKPLWFGTHSSCRVFGLPGNPVSTLTVFRRYVVPFLWASQGHAIPAPARVRLGDGWSPHPKLTLLLPAKQNNRPDSILEVNPVAYHGSGDFAALADSDGFVEIPPSAEPFESARLIAFYAWRG